MVRLWIEIDDDIYRHLLAEGRPDEPGVATLRRLLVLDRPPPPPPPPHDRNERLLRFVDENPPSWPVVRMYLDILGFLYKENDDFADKILRLQIGYGRVYFAASEEEILRSGRRSAPKKIHGTALWAMTNTSSDQKREALRILLHDLGYDESAVEKAVEWLPPTRSREY